MEVAIKKTIWIDEEEIAKSFLNGTFNDVLAAVDEYCAGLDDCDYYALDDNAYKEIEKEVEKIVTNRKKGENKMIIVIEKEVEMEKIVDMEDIKDTIIDNISDYLVNLGVNNELYVTMLPILTEKAIKYLKENLK